MRTTARYLHIPAGSGKETAAVAVNQLVQALSLSLGCFVFLGYRPSLIAIRPAAGVERKWNGRERKEGVAELKPNRRVQTSAGRAFRERGERKLVHRSFCFAGHFASEERKKQFIGFLRFDARALLLQLPI
jgi:hypothetical protein